VAHAGFSCEILTPEGEVFNGEVTMVSTRTTVGSIGILAHHEPLLGMLDPTELRLYRDESDVVRFAQGEGYIQVTDERVLILVEEAHRPDELDVAELRARIERAGQDLSTAEEGSEQARVAARDRRRAEAFLAIAEGGGS
jgi:F-type H+-transporting ATPase subunit epsilon